MLGISFCRCVDDRDHWRKVGSMGCAVAAFEHILVLVALVADETLTHVERKKKPGYREQAAVRR